MFSCSDEQYISGDLVSPRASPSNFDFYRIGQSHHYHLDLEASNRSSGIIDQLQDALFVHYNDSTSIENFISRYGQPLWQLAIDKGDYHLVPAYDDFSGSLAGLIYCVVDASGTLHYNVEDDFEEASPTVSLLEEYLEGSILDFGLGGFRFFDVRNLQNRGSSDDCEPLSVVKYTTTYMELATGDWVTVSQTWEVLYTIDCPGSTTGGGGGPTSAQQERQEACEKKGESWQNCLKCNYDYNEQQAINAIANNPTILGVVNECGCGDDYKSLVASTTTLASSGIDIAQCAQCDKSILSSLTSLVRDVNNKRHEMFENDCGESSLTQDAIGDMLSGISTGECDLASVRTSLFNLAQTQISQQPWSSTSNNDRANSLSGYMRLRNFQNKCGSGHENYNLTDIFDFNEMLTLDNNEFFANDICIDAVPLGSTMISFQGTGGCQNCISTTVCERQLPDGRMVIELPPCGGHCSQVGGTYGQPCISFTMSGSDAETFLNYISTEDVPCP